MYICLLGIVPSMSDTKRDSVAYLLLYVDDIVLTTSSPALLQCIAEHLHSQFAVKDLGDLHHFLGIFVTRSGRPLLVSATVRHRAPLERGHG